MENGGKKRLTTTAALIIGIGGVVLALVAGFVILWYEVIKPAREDKQTADRSAEVATEAPVETPAPTEKPSEQPTEAPEVTEQPTEAPEVTEQPTEEPAVTETPTPFISALPTEEPTPEITEEPTPFISASPTAPPTEEPTKEPTPVPTKKPDSFKFGGKTIKSGTKKIDGSKLGINGKSGKLRHIKPEEVENLVELCPDLEELSLDYCYMDDYAPLGRLTKLKTLKLRRCGEGGGNAVRDIDWVKDLKSLTYLHFGHNSISDLTPLKGLKTLKRLNLAYNDIEDDDLDALSELTNLTELSLYGLKKITDVGPLSELSNLTYLHLGYDKKLKNIKPLTDLTKLKSLRINKTSISDVSYFKNFKSLEKLDISGCPILFHDYYNLEDCTKLKRVVLDPKDSDAALALDDMINNGFGIEISYEWD